MPYVFRNWNRQQSQAPATTDYLEDADPSTLLKDPRWQREWRETRKRQATGADADKWTEEELIEDFYWHNTYAQSLPGALYDLYNSTFASDAQKLRMARMQRAYEMAPTRSVTDASAWRDWGAAMLLDPLNLFAIGKAGQGAWGAAKAGKGLAGIALAGAKSGGIAGAIEGGVSNAAIDVVQQFRDEDVGLSDGYSWGRGAVQAGFGAGAGLALGGTFGAAAGAFGARGMRNLARDARTVLPAEAFDKLSYDQARGFGAQLATEADRLRALEPLRRQAAEARGGATPEEAAPPSAAETVTGFDVEAMKAARKSAEDALDALMADGADPAQIRQAQRNVAAMIQLQRINELTASFDANTMRLLESDDATTRAKAARNTELYVPLASLARRIQANPTSATIKEVTEELDRMEAEAAATTAAAEAQAAAAANPEATAPEAAATPEPAIPEPAAPVEATPAPAKRGRGKKAAPAAAPEEIAPADIKAAEAEVAARGEDVRIEQPEVDDEALDALDAIEAIMRHHRGDPTYREAIEFVVNSQSPELRERTMAAYDGRYNNPNGLDAASWEKLQAANNQKATPARSRSKNKKGLGGKSEMAVAPDDNDIAAQLRKLGLMGKLARDPKAAAAREAEIAAQKQRELDNAKKTPEEIVKNPKRSGTGRATDTLAEGPVTAGQNDRGRPQNILKPGVATERDPISGEAIRTVTDGPAPSASTLSLDEFKLEAQRNAVPRTIREFGPDGKPVMIRDADGKRVPKTRETEAVPIAVWRANRDMTGVVGGTTRPYTTRKGKAKVDTGYVPRGTTLYYAPKTDRFYVHERDAMEAIGLTRPRRFSEKDDFADEGREFDDIFDEEAAPAAPEPRERIEVDREDIQAALKDLLAGRITLDEYRTVIDAFEARLAREEAAENPAVAATRAADVASRVSAPEGSVLAIRNKAKPSDVRVLTDKQAALGGGVGTLLGKADPADWEVGYVPAGTKSGTVGARDKFVPDEDFENRVAEITEAEAVQAADENPARPMPLDEAENDTADLMTLSGEELQALNDAITLVNKERVGAGLEAGYPRVARDSADYTPLVLHTLINELEGASWPKTSAGIDNLITTLEGAYSALAKVAPNGIERTTASKKQAIAQLEAMFSREDPKDLAAMLEFIESLDGERVPQFVKSAEGGPGYFFSEDSNYDNLITLGRVGGHDNPVSHVPAQVLYHEVAHWAYMNILTPSERLDFWRSVRDKYYSNGAFDRAAVASRAPSPSEVPNSMQNPQEFFANQFVGWSMSKRFRSTWEEDAPFFKRFFHIFRNLLKRWFRDDDFVDPDLEPLFERIVPPAKIAEDAENPLRTFVPLHPKKPLKNKQSNYLIAHINTASVLDSELRFALATGNVDATINAATDIASFLLRLTPDKRWNPTGSDTFSPLRNGRAGNYAKMIRTLGFEIVKALRLQVDQEKLAARASRVGGESMPTPEEDPFAFDIEGLGDDADIWLSKNEASVVADPEAVFEAIKAIADKEIRDALELTSGALNIRLKTNEGWAFKEDVLPLAYSYRNRRRAAPPESKAIIEKRAQRRAQRAATAKAAVEAYKNSKKGSKKSASPKTGKAKSAPSAKASPSTNLRDLTMSELADLYMEGGEGQQAQIAREMLRRQKAEPSKSFDDVTIPNEIKLMRIDQMEAELRQALSSGDGPRIEQIFAEQSRRGLKRGYGGRSNMVMRMVAAEREQSIGSSEDGLMPGAPVVVREIQSFMSHRDPEVQDTMRTLTYRALALMNKTMKDNLGRTNIMTTADIYRLANLEQPSNSSGAFADFRGEAFNKFRSDLRRLSIGLTKDVSDPFDVLHEIHHLALRTSLFDSEDRAFIRDSYVEALRGGDSVAARQLNDYTKKPFGELTPSELERLAEEWFAESGAIYAMGKVAKGDLFAIRQSGDMTALTGKSKLVELANRLIDAVAYMVNGLLGRRTMKHMFRRLDFGDMFELSTPHIPRSKTGVPFEYAAAYSAQVMGSQPAARLDKMLRFIRSGVGLDERGDPVIYYHGTPHGDLLSARDVVMGKGGGMHGDGIYLTRNPAVAEQVYAARGTRAALEKLIFRQVDEGKISPENIDEAMWAAGTMANTRREISTLQMLIASRATRHEKLLATRQAGQGASLIQDRMELEGFRKRLRELFEYEESLRDHLEDLGFRGEPKVLSLVVRAENPADFRPSKVYLPTDAFVTNLLADLEEGGHVSFEDARDWYASFADGTGRFSFDEVGGVRGDELYEELELLIGRQFPTEGPTILNRVLGARGYDAVQHVTRNTLDDGTRVSHDTLVLIDHTDPRTGKTVSASSKLKSIEATDFDDTTDILYASLIDRTPSPNGSIISQMAEERPDTSRLAAEIIAKLEGSGAPPDFTQTVIGMVRGRTPSLKKTAEVFSNVFHAAFSAASRRLELGGLKTLADWHRNHHIEHANLMGDRVHNLREALKDLPDAQKPLERWLQNSWKPRKQPESHARIHKALRMGLDSPAGKRLSDVEMKAAKAIRDMLDAEFRYLRQSGVIVGRIENYMPQVWDVEALQRDPDTFVKDLADYFMAEASRDGRPESRGSAEKRARDVWSGLIDDEGNYLPPPVGASRVPDSDHIRYQRLIRLEDPEFALNSERLGKFMVNDLEGTLIKYFDGSTRSALQQGRFGTLNHGYFDYLRVMGEGADGIAALLSTNRVARREIRGINPEDGYMSFTELRDETPMPFAGREFEAREAADRIIETFKTQGRDGARNLLMSLNVSRPPLGSGEYVPQAKSTYEHRVEAILDALQDGGGKRQAAKTSDIILAQDALRSALRKKIAAGPGNGDLSIAASRGIRTFNAVSLLTFTALTSIPDMALPIIRSGSMGANARAWRRYLGDPEYKAAIQRTGAAIESIVHGHMAGLFATDMSGKLGRFNHRFFNATGLTPWTDLQRNIAAATGFEAFRADINRAVNMRVGDGTDMSVQSADYKRTMRRLRYFGLDNFVRESRALTDDDLADPVVKRAVVQFANEAVFNPNPDDIPLWAQTPWGAVIFQLKSYPLMMMRMTGKMLGDAWGGTSIRDISKGDFSKMDPHALKRLAYFGTIGPALAAASLSIKDLVMMRGGEDNREAELRDRNAGSLPGFIPSALGYDPDLHGDENSFLGWYWESLMAMGGFGLLADTLHASVENADNGAFGQTRQISAILGPGVGDIASANIVAGGILDNDGTSNAKERAAWREALRRVPILGGIGAVREGAVDALAGEKQE